MPAKRQRPRKTRAPRRIILVDDHPMMRAGLAELINDQRDLTVCSEAGTAGDALKAVRELRPDLAIVDISLEGKSGIELIKEIRGEAPGLPVLVVSMHAEMHYVQRALRAGANGYLLKHAGGELLLQAIRQVLRGETYLSESISAAILDRFSGRGSGGPDSALERLTDRELDVFQLLGEGHGPSDIARLLSLNSKTVDSHCARLKRRLGLKGTPDLIRYALRWGETQRSPGS